MTKNIKVNAAILIIGNEILSGRTQDTNTSTLPVWLNSLGVQGNEVRVISDTKKIIIENLNVLRKKNDYVFTTGGIGPTHDDVTAEAIASAFNQKYIYHKKAYKILEDYYTKKEFNDGRKKMAKMPENAKLIPNPKTFAAGVYVDNVFVLPGVPEILLAMINELNKIIPNSEEILSISCDLFTRESEIADRLKNIQETYKKNVEIGSYPFFKNSKSGTSIVMRSKNNNILLECEKLIKKSFIDYLK